MTTYTRRGPGQSYLQKVLSDQLNSLCAVRDLDLEINPLKVYEHMVTQIEASGNPLPAYLPKGVTAEQAAANREVQKVIQPRLETLNKLASEFLDVIISGLEEVPYGIRWICKQIRSLSRRKYPDAHDQTICTLIGGFFFLRFINPAIVTPRSYMLIDSAPSENPKRTLTYVRLRKRDVRRQLLTLLDCKNATEPCEQALLRKGAIHGCPAAFRI